MLAAAGSPPFTAAVSSVLFFAAGEGEGESAGEGGGAKGGSELTETRS